MKLLERRGGRYAFSLLTGLLLAAAWPCIGDLTPLIFLAWAPLILVQEHLLVRNARPRAVYPHILLAMAVWNLCTTWWLWCVSEPLGTKLFTLIGPNVGNVLLMSVPLVLARVVRRRAGRGLGAVAFVVFWLAFERFHMNWDLTWPWLTLGNAFANRVEWVQWYEWTGHMGGSLWVLVANLLVVLVVLRCKSTRRWRLAAVPMAWVGLPLLGSLWYDLSITNYCPSTRSMEVVIVQPNIDPYNGKFALDPLVQLEGMLAQAESRMTDSTRLVVLPETALQEDYGAHMENGRVVLDGLWENDINASRSAQMIARWLRSHPQVQVLAGMSAGRFYASGEPAPITSRPFGPNGEHYDAYNAAVLVDTSGATHLYNKSKLVPFVELMPFEEVTGSLDALALDLGGTTGSLGTQEERSALPVAHARVAPIICYESVYGDYVTGYIANGADLLVIMTNDGWWDETPGHLQHLAYGRLRAIETRRSIVRCANTGISCFIDACGRVEQPTAWWQPAVIAQRVPLRNERTLFARTGDIIGAGACWASPFFLLAAFMLGRARRKA